MTEAGLPHLEAIHKPVRIDGASLLGGQIKTRTRKATYANPLASAVYYSINLKTSSSSEKVEPEAAAMGLW